MGKTVKESKGQKNPDKEQKLKTKSDVNKADTGNEGGDSLKTKNIIDTNPEMTAEEYKGLGILGKLKVREQLREMGGREVFSGSFNKVTGKKEFNYSEFLRDKYASMTKKAKAVGIAGKAVAGLGEAIASGYSKGQNLR